MSNDDRKGYSLRSNTSARTQDESAKLQKDPPRTSNVSNYIAAQYSPPVRSRPYASSASPRQYADSRYARPSASPIHPTQNSRPRYSARNDSSENLADPIADLTGQLSRTGLDQRPSTQDYRPAPVSAPPRRDAINEVVQEVLTRDLKKLGDEKLLPNNPIFDLARQFAQEWDISDEAVNSHIQLACGYYKFPVILLLNPAPTHEFLPFDQMVNECKTLRWIEDVLHGIGLALGDVIILDACTLLGSGRIKQLAKEGKRKKDKAMAEAYDVTQKMLRLIQPSIILSCQCSTSFPEWSPRRTCGGPAAMFLDPSCQRSRGQESIPQQRHCQCHPGIPS